MRRRRRKEDAELDAANICLTESVSQSLGVGGVLLHTINSECAALQFATRLTVTSQEPKIKALSRPSPDHSSIFGLQALAAAWLTTSNRRRSASGSRTGPRRRPRKLMVLGRPHARSCRGGNLARRRSPRRLLQQRRRRGGRRTRTRNRRRGQHPQALAVVSLLHRPSRRGCRAGRRRRPPALRHSRPLASPMLERRSRHRSRLPKSTGRLLLFLLIISRVMFLSRQTSSFRKRKPSRNRRS